MEKEVIGSKSCTMGWEREGKSRPRGWNRQRHEAEVCRGIERSLSWPGLERDVMLIKESWD